MPRRIVFRDLSELRHLYWEGWPETRIARHLRVDRTVVRRILGELGLPRHSQLEVNRFLAEERTDEQRQAFTAAARAARWSNQPSARPRIKTRRVGYGEEALAIALETAGVTAIRQAPVEGYFIDIACWPVAVELERHFKKAGGQWRVKTLQREGWSVLAVRWAIYATSFEAHELREIIDLVKAGRRDPPDWHGYRMFRCGFKRAQPNSGYEYRHESAIDWH